MGQGRQILGRQAGMNPKLAKVRASALRARAISGHSTRSRLSRHPASEVTVPNLRGQLWALSDSRLLNQPWTPRYRPAGQIETPHLAVYSRQATTVPREPL